MRRYVLCSIDTPYKIFASSENFKLKDPRAGLDPQRKAEVLAINGLLDKARELAKQGKLEQATGLFAKVKRLSENFHFEPMEKAQAIYNEANKQ